MREPYTQLFVHVVWSTWDRLPLLTKGLRERVYACIQAECEAMGARVHGIGGTEHHVHVLVQMPTTVSVAILVKQMKGSSSHLVNHELRSAPEFKWQGGYGAFTVSKSVGKTVREYIMNQEAHHRLGTTSRDMEVAWEEKEGD